MTTYTAGDIAYFRGSEPCTITKQISEKEYEIFVDPAYLRENPHLTTKEPEQIANIEDLEPATPHTIDSLCPEGLVYSPYGYIIKEDGTVHTIIKQYHHGAALALLYPEEAKAAGYSIPARDCNVRYYQVFDMQNGKDVTALRVATSSFGDLYLRKGKGEPNHIQINAALQCFNKLGASPNTTIFTDEGELPFRKLLNYLETGDFPFDSYDFEDEDF